MSVLSTSERCQKAASALRTKGHIHQRACVKCGKRNEDFRRRRGLRELATRSAPRPEASWTPREAARRPVADTFRDARVADTVMATRCACQRRPRAKSTWPGPREQRPSF